MIKKFIVFGILASLAWGGLTAYLFNSSYENFKKLDAKDTIDRCLDDRMRGKTTNSVEDCYIDGDMAASKVKIDWDGAYFFLNSGLFVLWTSIIMMIVIGRIVLARRRRRALTT